MTAVLEPIVVEEVIIKANPLADMYDHAASLIEEYGWVQGRFGNQVIGFCMIGAISYTFIPKHSDAYNPLLYATGWNGVGHKSSISIWNDTPGRTKEEVIAKLHEVASQLRSQDGNTDR